MTYKKNMHCHPRKKSMSSAMLNVGGKSFLDPPASCYYKYDFISHNNVIGSLVSNPVNAVEMSI